MISKLGMNDYSMQLLAEAYVQVLNEDVNQFKEIFEYQVPGLLAQGKIQIGALKTGINEQYCEVIYLATKKINAGQAQWAQGVLTQYLTKILSFPIEILVDQKKSMIRVRVFNPDHPPVFSVTKSV
jgi:hypothetical protein